MNRRTFVWSQLSRSSRLLLCLNAFPAAAITAFSSACAPDLPSPGYRAGYGQVESDSGIQLELEPAASLDAAPPILRMKISSHSVAPVNLDRVIVVEGEVTAGHLRQIERGSLSKALTARVVPALVWLDQDADDGGGAVVVAPTVPLSLGETYAVASGSPPFAVHIHVSPEDSAPRLDRIWPPADAGATLRFGVWCGSGALSSHALEASLEPLGPAGVLQSGVAVGVGARCIRFEAEPSSEAPELEGDAGFIAPPALYLPEGLVRLDPRPFTMAVMPEDVDPIPCEPKEVPFGPGCARVEDDRLVGRSPDAHLLWAVAGPGLDRVFTTAAGDPFILAPLPPLTSIALDVSVVDNKGTILRNVSSSTTLAPMAHIVLNEVLANPLGPEPRQEWIELINDGSVSANLAGYVLEDIGGETPLPSAELAPGAYAIIVNELFAEDDELDPVPTSQALILRVAKLGKSGLSNVGEPLKLLDSSGQIVSRFPAGPQVKAGMSVSRASPTAPDGLASSFKPSHPTPGAENGL